MKLSVFVILVFFSPSFLLAQNAQIDSLEKLLQRAASADTNRVRLLNELAFQYQMAGSEQSLVLADQALKLSRNLRYPRGEVNALRRLGSYYYQRAEYSKALRYFMLDQQLASSIRDTNALAWAFNGIGTVFHSKSNYPEALRNYLQAVTLFEKIDKQKEAASIMGNAGVLYKEMGNFDLAIQFYQRGLSIQEKRADKNEIARFLNNIGGIYSDQGKFAEAEKTFNRSLKLAREEDNTHMVALVLRNLLEMKVNQRDYTTAFSYGFESLTAYKDLGEKEGISDVSYQLAQAFLQSGKKDSALQYAEQSLKIAHEIGFKRNIHNTYNVLSQIYAARNDYKEAYKALSKSVIYKDSLTGETQQQQVAGLKFQYELDKKQSQIEMLSKDRLLHLEEAKHQRQRSFALMSGLLISGLFAFSLVRSNRQKQRTNLLLQKQKEEVQQTLAELRSTQAQLVQREKMASLGELTAGIAHEIQNPLNFVNNFSQVSEELLEELKTGHLQKLTGNDREEAEELISCIATNLNKILHHGKRADNIVKGMLQHSRSGTGQKELTDINALADEFLRLSYHGIRAKEKAFNATIKTDYDSSLEKVVINPGDMGRVFLNLFNNAFYSVYQKQKNAGNGYEPVVSVSTMRTDEGVEIRIKDNGTGIPEKVKDKIFHPFFTTKPSGQGTGLGLSLSYDIVTKGHGGQLLVDTIENGFAEFIIQLPVHSNVNTATAV